MTVTTYENITYEIIGKVARISLNRPTFRNAQNVGMLDELDHALAHADRDEKINVIILAAIGSHFSAGHDLKETQASRPDLSVEERWAHEAEHYLGYCLRLRDISKPTIAQVQGACIAAGFMVVNMCDLVVAADNAFFSDPVVHSLGASAVEVLVHPWVLGLRKAKEFLFAGIRISADEALAIGMVNKVVPLDELADETLALAAHIAKAPPFGVRLTKRSLNRAWDLAGMRSSLESHFDTHQLSHCSNEMKAKISDGFAATIDKAKTMTN